MKILRMALADLHQPEKNVRIHTEKQLREMERSVRMFGQIRPLVVDEGNTILAGNGLYVTLKKMGESEADVYQITGLSENQRKKLMIADNKIYGLGIDNLDTFNEFLRDLQNDLDIPGFDEDVLQCMVDDVEETAARVSEYGVLTEDDIDEIQSDGGRYEQKIAAATERIEQQPAEPAPQAGPGEPTADLKKCVVCPKCGERIWL